MSKQTDPFSIVVIPDSQGYAELFSQRGIEHMQWVADNREALNIVFCTHLGDLVQNMHRDNDAEWDEAVAAIDRLHERDDASRPALLPYSVSIGNHDFDDYRWLGYGKTNIVHGSEKFRSHFGPERFAGESWFGGSDAGFVYDDPMWGPTAGVGLSNYQTFTGGGRSFLHLNLEDGAPDQVLAWAKTVMARHRGAPTIVSTHAFCRGNGEWINEDGMWRRWADFSRTVAGNSAPAIWNKFIARHREIFLVLCGHTGIHWSATYPNAFGDDVYVQLACYTAKRLADDGDGGPAWRNGAGWLRVLTFEPAAQQIHVRTYSTVLDEWADNRGGGGKYPVHAYPNSAYVDGRLVPEHRSDFTIELDWDERLSVS